MDEELATHRDHFLSVFQSAAASYERALQRDRALGGPERPEAVSMTKAASEVADLKSKGIDAAAIPERGDRLERLTPTETARICAALGFQYLQAKVLGDERTASRISSELVGATCDPRWLRTIDEYLKFFGPGGSRREIPYVRAAAVGGGGIAIKADCRIGLIGDWGTGAEPARNVLKQLKAQRPDIVIHLGDIYYSGTPEECDANFVGVFNEVFGDPGNRIPVYSLSGNHDMYSGGLGYYGMIERLNGGAHRQPASFFCLRSEDDAWQFLAMDTGLHDYSPFSVNDTVPWIEADEEAWHRQRIEEFGGKTILLSHHPLFSAFSAIGAPDPSGKRMSYNPKLRDTYDRLRTGAARIPAWFWGHEHNLCIYEPHMDLPRGRCIGHSAIPVFSQDDPYETPAGLVDPPSLVAHTKLRSFGDLFAHGFAVLHISGATATAEYFEDRNGECVKAYVETIS